MNTSELIIRRDHALWQDRVRKYQILVDGKTVGALARGAEMAIPLPPGPHTVQMKIDWCSSPKLQVDCSAGQAVVLECGPNANPLVAMLYITLWKNKYLWLRPAQSGQLSKATA
jgi:hypothetical protein